MMGTQVNLALDQFQLDFQEHHVVAARAAAAAASSQKPVHAPDSFKPMSFTRLMRSLRLGLVILVVSPLFTNLNELANNVFEPRY